MSCAPSVLWLLRALLALFFVGMGLPKVLGSGAWATRFAAWGCPAWFVVLVGISEMVGAAMLLVPRLSAAGATGLSVIMLGAMATHLLHGEHARLVAPLGLLILLIVSARGRR